jgi:hypothetical protein
MFPFEGRERGAKMYDHDNRATRKPASKAALTFEV